MVTTLSTGGILTMQSEEMQSGIAANCYKVLDRPEVSNGLKSILLYKPLADTLTFGLYSYIAGEASHADA